MHIWDDGAGTATLPHLSPATVFVLDNGVLTYPLTSATRSQLEPADSAPAGRGHARAAPDGVLNSSADEADEQMEMSGHNRLRRRGKAGPTANRRRFAAVLPFARWC